LLNIDKNTVCMLLMFYDDNFFNLTKILDYDIFFVYNNYGIKF